MSDDDMDRIGELPSSLSGTVILRLFDSDRTPGNALADTVWIDELFIRTIP